MSDHFLVTRDALELPALVAQATRADCGALSSFVGTVRSPNAGQEVRYIEYQGYEAMIQTQMKRTADELRSHYDLGTLVFAHRLGRLFPQEVSIAIVISSPHRKDGLNATHAAIDRLKELLPIWKLEVTADGQSWVEGSSTASDPL